MKNYPTITDHDIETTYQQMNDEALQVAYWRLTAAASVKEPFVRGSPKWREAATAEMVRRGLPMDTPPAGFERYADPNDRADTPFKRWV